MSAPKRRPIVSIVAWPCVALALLAFVTCATLLLPHTLLFDRRRTLPARLGSRGTMLAMWLVRSTRPAIIALQDARTRRGVVVVVNHRSVVDILLAVAMPGGPRLLAKQWPARTPLLGTSLRLAGHLTLDEQDPDSVRATLDQARDYLAHGIPIVFFAEGSRRREPGLSRFRGGAFALAIDAQVPVVPVVLHNSGTLVPPGALTINETSVTAEVLEDFSPGNDRRALTRRVHAAMLDRLRDAPA